MLICGNRDGECAGAPPAPAAPPPNRGFTYLIFGTISILAFIVDQVNLFGPWDPMTRFLLSCIHPVAVVVEILYLVPFTACKLQVSWKRAVHSYSQLSSLHIQFLDCSSGDIP